MSEKATKRARTGDKPTANRDEWAVPASVMSKRFINPIRNLVDTMVIKPNPDKEMIPLSIGDPTKFGNFPTTNVAVEALVKSVREAKWNGYTRSTGYEEARQAIADMYTCEQAPLTSEDIIIASGCSGALDLAIGALGDEGSNILVPAPGFSLYTTLASAKGIETRSYKCRADKDWEIDLEQMASLIDSNTRAIIVTNPSNPCGSNFSRAHVIAITEVASRLKVPIIADEIYADMVFGDDPHTAMASIGCDVPVLTCGGLAKRWLVPGWRVGWIMIADRNDVFKEVRGALNNLSQLLLGANTVAQAAVPAILGKTPDAFYKTTLANLKRSAELCFTELSKVPGLTPVKAGGAMYLMVAINVDEFKDIVDDRDFVEKLITEQSVFPLPATVFEAPNYFRIVTTVPEDKMREAMGRIGEFCAEHHK